MSDALDAAKQRQLREAASAAADKPAPLNPPFPWKMRAFDPQAFGVLADPVVAIDSPAKPNPPTH